MVQRIVGLASGMDIDTMVKNLMQAEKQPLDKLKQNKQVLEWQRDDYRSMNSLFLDFRSTLTNMKLSSQYRVRSTDSSNDSLVTATASSGANLSSYTISSVGQLASAANKVNNGAISGTTKIDPNASLISQQFPSVVDNSFKWQPGSVQSQSITVKDGVAPKVDFSNVTLVPNTTPNTTMNVQVNGVNYKVVTDSTNMKDNEVVVGTDGALTFTTNTQNTVIKSGTTIKVDYVVKSDTDYYSNFGIQTYNQSGVAQTQNFLVSGNDSLNSVINKVNNSSVGVTMFYDSFSDKVTLTRKDTGKFNTVDSSGEIATSGNFMTGILKFDGTTKETGGENAQFYVNGLRTERNSNTFEMNGITFTLKQVFNKPIPDPTYPNDITKETVPSTTNPVTISVKNDTDKVFDNIKSFVDKYNKLIDQVNTKLNEDRNRDYPPLTDDQKEQLSDTQQQQWTDKAKSGLLKGDSILSSGLNQIRALIYQPVNNASVSSTYNQLASIGITTTSNYLDGGKLQIDEAKLKQAIQNDPDSVENLFHGTGDSTESEGIAQRLFDSVSSTMDKIKAKAGNSNLTNKQFSIGLSLDNVNTQIDSLNTRLTQVENRYYSQFTAMEQAIQQSNSQATYIQQMLGGGQ